MSQYTEPCPCGIFFDYVDCCGRFIQGKEQAKTAEQLMRSRYSAYVKKAYDYIIATTHPDDRKNSSIKHIKEWADEMFWTRLIVLDVTSGGAGDKTGKVEFEAHYVHPITGPGFHHERSKFRKHHGQWFYLA